MPPRVHRTEHYNLIPRTGQHPQDRIERLCPTAKLLCHQGRCEPWSLEKWGDSLLDIMDPQMNHLLPKWTGCCYREILGDYNRERKEDKRLICFSVVTLKATWLGKPLNGEVPPSPIANHSLWNTDNFIGQPGHSLESFTNIYSLQTWTTAVGNLWVHCGSSFLSS